MFKRTKLGRLMLLLFITFFFAPNGQAQTKYDEGFDAGYKKGYCNGIPTCVTVSPPPVPPLGGESMDSYQDGYDKGFKMGLDAQNKSSNGGTKKGYKTSNDEPIDYMHKPTEFEAKLAAHASQNFETCMARAQEEYNEGEYAECINLCNLTRQITHEYSTVMLPHSTVNVTNIPCYKCHRSVG